MSRRYRNGNYDNLDYGEMSMLEFEFSNRQEKIISDEALADIKTQLEGKDSDVIFKTDSGMLDKKQVLRFAKKIIIKNVSGKKIEKSDIYVKLMTLSGKWYKGFSKQKFITEILPKVKSIVSDRILLGYNYDNKNYSYQFNIHNLDYARTNDDSSRGENSVLFFENEIDLIKFVMINTPNNEGIKSFSESNNINELSRMIKDVFNIEVGEIEIPKYNLNDNYSPLSHILKVFETRIDNKQYRIFIYIDDIAINDNRQFKLSIVSENNDDYNYIDEGRFVLFRNYHYGYSSDTIRYIDMGLFKKNHKDEYEIDIKAVRNIADNINNLLSAKEKVITKSIYEFYCKRDNIIQHSENSGSIIAQKIYDKYVEKLEKGETIIINGIELSKKSIEMKEQNLKIEFKPEVLNVVGHFDKIKKHIEKINETDFGEFFLELLNMSKMRSLSADRISHYISDVDREEYAKIKKKMTINGIQIELTNKEDRYYLNDIFIRKDDISELITKATCYNSKEDYEAYLKDVSFIGMDWKTMLSNGVNVRVQKRKITADSYNRYRNDTQDDEILMRFSFSWDTKARSKIYIVIDEQKYLIRYKPNFYKYFYYNNRVMNITELIGCLVESVEGITLDNVMGIIETAEREARIVKERGEELVRETIRDTKATEGKLKLSDYDEREGYYLVGIKGNKYFIDKKDLNVYKFKDGQYQRRCVVDVAGKHRIFEDRIANRLINIYNENPRIHTIQV